MYGTDKDPTEHLVDDIGNILDTFSGPHSLGALKTCPILRSGRRYWKEVKDTTLFDLSLQSS